MTRWKLVVTEPTEEMLARYDNALRNHIKAVPKEQRAGRWGAARPGRGYKVPDNEKAAARYSAMLSASPSPGEDVVEKVAALLGKEIYCGQDEAAPADNPCKKTWAAYKRRCPECALHPNERNDLARAVLKALEG